MQEKTGMSCQYREKWNTAQGEAKAMQAAMKWSGSKLMVQIAGEQQELLLAAGQLQGGEHPDALRDHSTTTSLQEMLTQKGNLTT